jgi:hypothetical protein
MRDDKGLVEIDKQNYHRLRSGKPDYHHLYITFKDGHTTVLDFDDAGNYLRQRDSQ